MAENTDIWMQVLSNERSTIHAPLHDLIDRLLWGIREKTKHPRIYKSHFYLFASLKALQKIPATNTILRSIDPDIERCVAKKVILISTAMQAKVSNLYKLN
jgi:hypothetical protein